MLRGYLGELERDGELERIAEPVALRYELAAAELPVPTFFERETGPYITAGAIVARDPESGRRNLSIARIKPLDDAGAGLHSSSVKVLALDYGAARTGVAVSDATGTLARPLEVVQRASSAAGLARIGELVRREEVDRIVVGLPLTLRGEHGAQAAETGSFVDALRARVDVPVETFDERFTTRLAERSAAAADEDAVAAAHLLTGYLTWSSGRRP